MTLNYLTTAGELCVSVCYLVSHLKKKACVVDFHVQSLPHEYVGEDNGECHSKCHTRSGHDIEAEWLSTYQFSWM
jgi:hypothetical protein